MSKATDRRTKILLVDDDPVVLNSLGSGLKALDYEVESCRDGKLALEANRQNPPDLIVMDFNMPGLSGIETIEAMSAERSCPVIILTAYSDVNIVRAAVGAGVSAYLVKPVEAERLAPSIEAALVRYREVAALLRQDANVQDIMEKNRIINAAVGIVMERCGLPFDTAFEQLRRYARNERRVLKDIAFELVDGLSGVNETLSRLGGK
ncbi:MAG: response regulator [Gammaproteobacteria bacterium]|nr:response regulator [Gammaproteobacteria bacterium]